MTDGIQEAIGYCRSDEHPQGACGNKQVRPDKPVAAREDLPMQAHQDRRRQQNEQQACERQTHVTDEERHRFRQKQRKQNEFQGEWQVYPESLLLRLGKGWRTNLWKHAFDCCHVRSSAMRSMQLDHSLIAWIDAWW
ncbi:MAG: hypothetical protein ACJ8AI_09475 [Rhodopila sp.]